MDVKNILDYKSKQQQERIQLLNEINVMLKHIKNRKMDTNEPYFTAINLNEELLFLVVNFLNKEFDYNEKEPEEVLSPLA